MARTRRSRARQYGGGGGKVDLGAIIDAFGGDPKLSAGAKSFLEDPSGELPENIYDSPGVARRLFFPSSSGAALEGNDTWTQSRLASAYEQAQSGRMTKEELAERTELEFLDVLEQSRGEMMSSENKARKKQLEDKFAKARAGTLGNKTTELGNEGLRLGNEAKALGNRESSETSAGRVSAVNAVSRLGAARGESDLRLLPAEEAAKLMEARRRGIDASRVPGVESPEYQEISAATGELGESRLGPNWLRRVIQKGLEFDEQNQAVGDRARQQQEYNTTEAEKDRQFRREESEKDRAARVKSDPFMDLLTQGSKTGGAVDLGDGTFAVPREVATSQPKGIPVTVEAFNEARATPLEVSQIRTLPGLVEADPEFAGLYQPQEKLFSQRDEGFSGLANLANPVSPYNMLNRIVGNQGGMGAGDLFLAPGAPAEDAPEWYKNLTPEERRRAQQEILANMHTRKDASKFR